MRTTQVMVIGRRALLLAIVALLLAVVVNHLRPAGLPWSGRGVVAIEWARAAREPVPGLVVIDDIAYLRRWQEEGDASFVDARSADDFAAGHLLGAISLPPHDLGPALELRAHRHIMPGLPVVVYCRNAACPTGHWVARFLLERGFDEVHVFSAGWRHLTAADLMQERGPWRD